MRRRSCPGCGVPFQSDDPEAYGYVPAEVLARDEAALLCRRCFRLRHYGDAAGGPPALEAVRAAVGQAVKAADCVLLVADAFDFEASIAPPVRDLVRPPLVVAVNKVDLLPPRTPLPEVGRWAEGRLAAAGLPRAEVHLISARTGWGTRRLWERLAQRAGRGTVAVLGATNVGKSALLAHWVQAVGYQGPAPTVSPVPGTTLALLRLRLVQDGFTLLDTPGIPPPGRVSDRLCPECAKRVVPDRRLQGRLWQVAPGQAMMLGTLAVLEAAGPVPEGTVLIAYGAQGLPMHRTRTDRVEQLLARPPRSWADVPCQNCRARLAEAGCAEHRITLAHAHDLAIHGLGWVTLRGGPLDLRLRLPEGVHWTVRPNLLGPKDRWPAP
ncbi:MAG TPA: GTPase [Limnochordales bacterium]|nr:GTPase [Limnochordales bacterium]